ncbi:MAG: MBL fold metallo-hydrolase [Actinobacteria bacterium]|nr:MBL fold metallo-hydrolase [Actinomycetota bacterium]
MGSPGDKVVELFDGGPLAFCNPYPVDGRVSWHAAGARGWAPMNSYLLAGTETAVLIDPGLSIHREDVLEQVRGALNGRELVPLLLRQGEFDSICNVAPLVDRFGVRRIYGEFPDAFLWADVVTDPELFASALDAGLENLQLRPGETLEIEGYGGLEALPATLRLLNTLWLFDARSGTLFTSDSFSYLVSDEATGPWVLDAGEEDRTTVAAVAEHLVTTRYWWLRGADVGPIRDWLRDVFASREVNAIAPAFGRIVRGSEAVARHLELLDGAIARLGSEQSGPVADRRFERA